MTVAQKILAFYDALQAPKKLPKSVITMNPYQDKKAIPYTKLFYEKYYNDSQERTVLFGINPGRFGGGVTGIPFTDPVKLEEDCEIPNPFDKRQELSSRFVYEVIDAFGGPNKFYADYYISAISPLGFIQNGKNLNYYDIKDFKKLFEKYAHERILEQLDFPLNRKVAYSIGQGQNLKFLKALNDKHKYFERIETVPHPRWVMQYRLKRKQEFIDEYLRTLTQAKN
ncbi:MAG: uracil-DNA glycosylase family protein [Cyclobacteriaceae bacterium]